MKTLTTDYITNSTELEHSPSNKKNHCFLLNQGTNI